MAERLIAVGMALLVLAIVAVAAAVIVYGDDCPEGQSLQVIGYMPVTSGKVITQQPMYGCERN